MKRETKYLAEKIIKVVLAVILMVIIYKIMPWKFIISVIKLIIMFITVFLALVALGKAIIKMLDIDDWWFF